MGRGSDYSQTYPHFMLFDDDNFQIPGEIIITVTFDGAVPADLIAETATKYDSQPEIEDNVYTFTVSADNKERGYDIHNTFASRDDCEVNHNTSPGQYDQQGFDIFLSEIAKVFGLELFSRYDYTGNESYIFASDDRLNIGVDRSGGMPCIWVKPETYLNGDVDVPYRIDRRVQIAFNKLIKDYQPDFFRFPTTAWTSSPLTTYARADA